MIVAAFFVQQNAFLFKDWWHCSQLVACLLFSIVMLVGIPLLLVRVLVLHREDLDEKEMRESFGTTYMGMKTDTTAGVF